MAQYAIAFDLDTAAMRDAGLARAQITTVYQTEIPEALAGCGFTQHPQGSLYQTEAEADPITANMRLQGALRTKAENFCRYVRRVHVFRMEEWSDVTVLISTVPVGQPAGPPAAEEEVAEAEFLEARR